MVGKTRFVAFCCRGSFNKFHCCQRVNKSHHHHLTQEARLWSLMWTWFLHVFTKHETWWSHHDTLREKIAQAFIAELTRQSFAVVAVPVPMAAPLRGIFAAPETVLGHSGAAGPLVWSFKRQGELKDWNSVLAPLATVRSCYVLHQMYWMYIVLIRLELFWDIHASRKVADVHWGVGCRWFKEIAFSQWMALGCPRRSFFSWSFSPLWWLLVRNAARSEGWAWPMQRTCSMQRICCCPPFKSWFLSSIGSVSICWTTHSLNVSSWQESIAAEVMGAWCTSQKLPLDLAKERFGDLSFAPPGSSSEVGWKSLTCLSLMLIQGSWMLKVTKYLYLRL